MGMQESVQVGTAEAPPIDRATSASPATPGDPLTDPRALQILSTEHWSLIASRSLAYNEAFSRAGMFLTFLSATLIVMGFLVGGQGLSSAVVPIAAILLLADLFIGMATVGRLIDASAEELQCIRGMNRIRHAYREMVPGIEPYFVSGFHDDAIGVLATYGDIRGSSGVLPNIIHGLTTTVGMVGTIDALILGALCAVVAIGLDAGLEVALPVALAGFLVGFVVLALVGMRTAMRQQARAESHFPTPDNGRR
jgi:hypothetical protein